MDEEETAEVNDQWSDKSQRMMNDSVAAEYFIELYRLKL